MQTIAENCRTLQKIDVILMLISVIAQIKLEQKQVKVHHSPMRGARVTSAVEAKIVATLP